jgi:hypothetical protein
VTAVENNFAGDVMDCNGTVALIFCKQGCYIGMNVNAAFTKHDTNL